MDGIYHTTKWLKFVIRESYTDTSTNAERKSKTVVIEVINTSDQHLGWIRWFGTWRQYVFDPTLDAPTTFNNGCLQGVVDMLTHLNSDHGAKRKITGVA